MHIQKTLQDMAVRFANKPALVFKAETVSFSQLRDRVGGLALGLRKAGIAKGDKVAIYLPNCCEYVYSYLACLSLGAVCVPLDFMLTADELISCMAHAEAKALIVQPKPGLSLEALQSGVPGLRLLISCHGEIPGALSVQGLIAQPSTAPVQASIAEGDPALIMYTSGTTGKPKGIRLNYKHLAGSPAAMHHFVDLTDRDVKLAAIPFSHIGGFIYIQNCILFGITLVIMDRFNPMEFLRLVEQHTVTCFHIVPPMYTAILTLKEIEKFDLSSLRWVVVFGAPSSPEILQRFHQYCPNAQLLNGWGMTETCPPNTVTPLGSTNIASVGKPAPHCEIAVVDDADTPVAIGEIGELVIRGWVVMDCYYKDPEATAEMKRNGWFHTGDLARFDTEGFLYIVGRKKEMIKVGGQIVYAPEVEAALYKHPAVVEAAVIGVADELRGEAVKAFVVVKEGAAATAEDIRYFLREHLAHFKVPQTISIVPALAKNRVGKIDKSVLR